VQINGKRASYDSSIPSPEFYLDNGKVPNFPRKQPSLFDHQSPGDGFFVSIFYFHFSFLVFTPVKKVDKVLRPKSDSISPLGFFLLLSLFYI
jgi:hypothetical protein